MKKYYFTLTKEKRKKIKDQYKKEYEKSDLRVRLLRLNLYTVIGYLSAIIILIYTIKIEEEKTGSIIIAVILIIASTIFLIGRSLIKINVLNKIALKNK